MAPGAEHEAKGSGHLDLRNFEACVEDVKRAALESEEGPKDPASFEDLRSRLEQARAKFPPLYREHVVEPYILKIDELGPGGFQQVLLRDPNRQREACLMFDIAQAILQYADGYLQKASAAFQEVVSDLYDGFLSVQDRKSLRMPSKTVVPPLVKWGSPDSGPYTWTCSATKVFNVRASIVNMPPAHARMGLLAWTGLAHETAGHDVMAANDGLVEELSTKVRERLTKDLNEKGGFEQTTIDRFVGYWSTRIEESASDVLGILNMGPVAALGLVGYLQAMNQAWGSGSTLRYGRTAYLYDPHPMDLMRGYLAVAAVLNLKHLENAGEWALAIENQMSRDEKKAQGLGGPALRHTSLAKESAAIVADTIMNGPLLALSGHCLSDIQTWGTHDSSVSDELKKHFSVLGPVREVYTYGYYAAHVVASAVHKALCSEPGEIAMIFTRMIGILRQMHECNPSWGPLYVEHPSDLMTMRMYIPSPEGKHFHSGEPQAKKE